MTPQMISQATARLCRLAPVVPVLVIEEAVHAKPLAQALVAGGLPVLEVTLRTPAALEAIARMAEVSGGHVGAGTVLTPADLRAAKAAGASFVVSPGVTPDLLDAAEAEDMPILPGAATASEVMALMARGYSTAKFFPAATIGGVAGLKALGGPLPQMGFCPTGGISLQNAPDYLKLANVLCVGGSWVASSALVQAGDWAAITALAREAAALPRP